MPRNPNDLPTEHIKLSTTPQVVDLLRRLVATGLYGKNHTEAAERLLTRSLEEMQKDGRLSR